MLPLCLVVSADCAHVAALQAGLRSHGLKLYRVSDIASMAPILGQWRFDAVLCDADGLAADALLATIRWLRGAQHAPIVVLASDGQPDAPLDALEAGATELIDKASSPQLMALKLQRLIELAADPVEAEPPRAVSLGELRLDPRREAAFYGDRPLALTGGEFELLLLLASRPGDLVHRETIARTLGRASNADARRSADMHICRIRRKLREVAGHGLVVETVYGRGYLLRMGAPAREAEEHRAAEWSV